MSAQSWPARGLPGPPAAPGAAETCWGHGPSAVPARTSPAAIEQLGRREAVFCRVISPQQSQVNHTLWFKSVPVVASLGLCLSPAVGHCPLPGPPFTALSWAQAWGLCTILDVGRAQKAACSVTRLRLQEVTGREGPGAPLSTGSCRGARQGACSWGAALAGWGVGSHPAMGRAPSKPEGISSVVSQEAAAHKGTRRGHGHATGHTRTGGRTRTRQGGRRSLPSAGRARERGAGSGRRGDDMSLL